MHCKAVEKAAYREREQEQELEIEQERKRGIRWFAIKVLPGSGKKWVD